MAQRIGRPPVPLEARLFPHLVITEPPMTHDVLGRPLIGPCLIWTLGTHKGYGIVWVNEDHMSRRVHRVMHEMFVGPIENTIDHLCRVYACGSPAHLEDVTTQENTARRVWYPAGDPNFGALNRAKTHCPNNHPYDEANTRWEDRGRGRVSRKCRRCQRERKRERRLSTRYPTGHPN